MSKFKSQLEIALTLEMDYGGRFQLPNPTPSAVLVLFAEDQHGGSPHVLVTRRTETVETHKGQMAFPGGVCDPEDFEQAGEHTTALRETEEEVGIHREKISVLGGLPKLWTPSGFQISPVVGWLDLPFSQLELRVNQDEIAETIWVPWNVLIDPATYRLESKQAGSVTFPIHVYQVGPHRIWGATGAILWNLIQRLNKI